VSAVLEARLRFADRDWATLLTAPRSKLPANADRKGGGLTSATTDRDRIVAECRACPEAGAALATGFPAPTVFDVDHLELLRRLLTGPLPETPTVASPGTPGTRRHFYFAGLSRSTFEIKLGGRHVGELRSVGSYVVIPPSVHPNGREYTWLAEPRGPLPQVPAALLRLGHTPGRGLQEEVELVPPGSMYMHLLDVAIRCARAGLIERVATTVLLAEFEAVRVPGAAYGDPRRGRRDTERMAAWAAQTRIAANTRSSTDLRDDWLRRERRT
jgi:Bifunctional DNA primase/polymerase, N-terminal